MARETKAEQLRAAQEAAHYQQTDDTSQMAKRLLKSKSFWIGLGALLIGDLCGGAWVYYHGPKVGGWDSFGSKSYAELIEEHERDVRLHDEDVRVHDEDVRLHVIDVRLHDEDVLNHDEDVKNQRESADRLAVLESQNKWLWPSHCVFKAVLNNDKSWLLRDGAWEFAKENWPQSELEFVAESFHKKELAESETAFNNREAHQQNKLLFTSSMLWDNVDELKRVDLSDLPPGWVSEYRQLAVRLKQIGSTNVAAHLESIQRTGIEAAEMRRLKSIIDDHPLGGSQ